MVRERGKCGDIVTCPNGHEICELIEDIDSGMVATPNVFGHWRPEQVKPANHMPVDSTAVCGICGRNWALTEVNGIALHLKDVGWSV